MQTQGNVNALVIPPALKTWIALSFLFVSSLGTVTAGETYEKNIKPILAQYCFQCHGEKLQKGKVDLSIYTNEAAIFNAADKWKDVVRVLREHEMPPEDKTQPKSEERIKVAEFVANLLNNIDESKLPKDPGFVVFHRLSREEYNNTVRDMFGIGLRPADKFPADGGGGSGFDNNASTLFVQPLLFESYMNAANEIMDAVKDEKLMIAKPADATPKAKKDAAKKVLEFWIAKAYRRPPIWSDTDRLMGLFDLADKKGHPFEASIRHALKGMLVSPNFLFRVEQEKNGTDPYEIGQYEMATRLSYFLWSSMPDDELFKLAAEKKLQEPAVLEAQVQRMLKDKKAMAFADNFTGQWLNTRNLDLGIFSPDNKKFPEFTGALRDAMCNEPVEFVLSLLRENGSLLKLIDSDYTFVNEELAKFYGLSAPEIKGKQMQRVKLTDPNRGGVLGMGAVLTATSHPLRTSPVLRGKWILEEILGAPPPPPPPNTPTLPKDDNVKEAVSLRKRLEEHRKNPNCATCHNRIDPLGFPLENYDPIGRWRDKDVRGEKIDTSGTLPTGEALNGPGELKKTLLKRKDDFVRTFTEKMMGYALGRGLENYDRPVLKKIIDASAKQDYGATTLITEIVKSFPFRFRRNAPVKAPTGS